MLNCSTLRSVFPQHVQMFGDVVKGVKMAFFDEALTAAKKAAGVLNDNELKAPQVTVHETAQVADHNTY